MEIRSLTLTEGKVELDLSPVDKELTPLIVEARTVIQVRGEPSYKRAGELVALLKSVVRKADKVFEPFEDEIAEKKRGIETVRKDLASLKADYLKEANEQISRVAERARAWYTEEERKRKEEERIRREEEEKRIQEEAKKRAEAELAGEPIPEEVPQAPVEAPKVMPKAQGFSIVHRWVYKWSGEPLAAEYTTYDEKGFPVPDHKKIQAVVTALKGSTTIKGVSAFEQTGSR
jgi:F0F1-type ATP synthase membrane subunit b/b'